LNGRIPWNKGKSSKEDSRILSGNKSSFYGKHHSKKTKEKIRKTKLEQYKNDLNLGKRVSEGTKKAMEKPEIRKKFEKAIAKRNMSGIMKGKNNPFFGKHHTEETKRKISQNKERSKKISIKRKEWWNSEDNTEKQRIMLMNLRNNHVVVSMCNEILNNNKINFEREFKINGKFYDYYIPNYNLLIEVDGEYWHPKGLKLEEMDKIQKKNYYNDKLKNRVAKKNNYLLKRFWVGDIKSRKI